MMNSTNAHDIIYEYIRQNKYMTLATADLNGKPEAATVEYVVDGNDLLINTFIHYRKFANLISNPAVACVITTAHDQTMQFDGTIRMYEGQEGDVIKQKMLEMEPSFAEFFNDEKTRFFRITPTWMRLRDYTSTPMLVTEYQALT